MKIARMYKGDWKKVRAFFDLETSDGFTIKGFKIIEGINGLFVSMPSQNKEGEYYDTVFVSKELRQKLNDVALQEYNNSTSRPQKRSGGMSELAREIDNEFDGSEGVDLEKEMGSQDIPF
jgi:stage V sporulation protein G